MIGLNLLEVPPESLEITAKLLMQFSPCLASFFNNRIVAHLNPLLRVRYPFRGFPYRSRSSSFARSSRARSVFDRCLPARLM